ncbi:hypothetical protein PAECIP111890_03063 [Paenibacillus sp. JJ-223]|nr:hypothetical protein PAECIP111890_03063 [Paenibacillus sp. JJ-223]
MSRLLDLLEEERRKLNQLGEASLSKRFRYGRTPRFRNKVEGLMNWWPKLVT